MAGADHPALLKNAAIINVVCVLEAPLAALATVIIGLFETKIVISNNDELISFCSNSP